MHNIIVIIKREFITRVQSKAFVITTIITPLLLGLLMVVPSYLMQMDEQKEYNIVISDPGNQVFDELLQQMNDTLETGIKKYQFIRKEQKTDITDEMKKSLEEEKYEAFVFIPSSVSDSGEIVYYSKNVANFDLIRPLRQTINNILLEKRIIKYDLDPNVVKEISRKISMKTIKIRRGEAKESGFGQDFIISYIFVLILYITILIYGQTTGRSVLEDKRNRVYEVLLSSANSKQIMAGKLLGVGSVGLFQYLIWVGFGALLFMMSVAYIPPEIMGAIQLDISILGYFVLFFLLGYFLYSSMILALASVVNSDEEFQQLFMPVVMLIIVPLLIMGMIVKDPNSSVAIWTSMVPFFSPMLMMMRVTITTPPVWQVAGSIIILLTSIWVIVWLSAKIFRTGILMYGKRPTLPELVKWMRYK